ncbi:unnamed protein product, partial [Prorocentrum cordatum]
AAQAGGARASSITQDSFFLEESPAERDKHICEQLDHFQLLLEYERLKEIQPPGMYVLPSFDSVYSWHGTMFVRQGFYRGGVFKFKLEIPENYPDRAPDLFFTSEVFHPIVEPSTGRVDLGVLWPDWPEWEVRREFASFALPFLHKIMLREEYFVQRERPALNQEALGLFASDRPAFVERARLCANLTAGKTYVNTNFSLQFTRGPEEAHDEILQMLKPIGNGEDLEDRKARFFSWFSGQYSQMRPAVEVSQDGPETMLIDSVKRSPRGRETGQLQLGSANFDERRGMLWLDEDELTWLRKRLEYEAKEHMLPLTLTVTVPIEPDAPPRQPSPKRSAAAWIASRSRSRSRSPQRGEGAAAAGGAAAATPRGDAPDVRTTDVRGLSGDDFEAQQLEVMEVETYCEKKAACQVHLSKNTFHDETPSLHPRHRHKLFEVRAGSSGDAR